MLANSLGLSFLLSNSRSRLGGVVVALSPTGSFILQNDPREEVWSDRSCPPGWIQAPGGEMIGARALRWSFPLSAYSSFSPQVYLPGAHGSILPLSCRPLGSQPSPAWILSFWQRSALTWRLGFLHRSSAVLIPIFWFCSFKGKNFQRNSRWGTESRTTWSSWRVHLCLGVETRLPSPPTPLLLTSPRLEQGSQKPGVSEGYPGPDEYLLPCQPPPNSFYYD